MFAFSDRNGGGNNPGIAFPSMSHNAMMAHSIRGKVSSTNEGPRYCVSCHLTTEGMTNYGTEYAAFRTAMTNGTFSALDFQLLKSHIGQNPGNQINSPLWVHQVAGLGSGLFLFDQDGCAVNPLDTNPDRFGCEGVAPANNYDPNRVRLNLDRIVETTGRSNGSSNHAMLTPGATPAQRDGGANTNLAGPLGLTLVQRLTDPILGIVLDSWLDADGATKGDAGNYAK